MSDEQEQWFKETLVELKRIMDEVFDSHIGQDVAPYRLTNEAHIGAILLGMGVGSLEYKNGEFSVSTKVPTYIYWTGKKFNIAMVDG